MKMVTAESEILTFKELDQPGIREKLEQKNFEGQVYNMLHEIMKRDGELVKERFPKVLRRVTGYSLDEFLNEDKWNLSKLICGSEGTLGTILEMKLNLVEQPKLRCVCPIHYRDRMEAIAEVKNILKFGPSAVELLDDTVIGIAKENPSTKDISYFIEGDPGAILIVEFFGDSEEELKKKFAILKDYLDEDKFSYHAPYYPQGKTFNDIWDVRKKGLGLLLSMRTPEKPLPFIEDACIPVESLAAYIREILDFCDKEEAKVILYAHASAGVLHVRPILDMRKKEDIDKLSRISEHTLDLVIKYKGSWSGEHGDGISRSFGIPKFFGDQIYEDFKKIKFTFDPENRMNPGKIVDAPQPVDHLRYGVYYKDQEVETVYHYRKELGFGSLVHMCNGVGVCQRVTGGVMCPSYKASLDEKDSTRGRANVLRLTLSGQINNGDLAHEELMQVMDLCVSCKSCKTECPSNVDMAKMKSEVLQKHYDKKGIGLRGYFIILSDDFSKWFSGPLSGLINAITRTQLFRKALELIAKIDSRRILDAYAKISLNRWYKKRFEPTATGQKVVLFADTYINFHQVEIGIAILTLLDKMNYQVELIDTGGSKRPLISNGFLKRAKKKGEEIAKKLQSALQSNTPVIVCEPSGYSALVEDIPDLINDVEIGLKMKENIISLEHFIADFVKDKKGSKVFSSSQKHHVIHGHCHQKAMEGTEYLSTIFGSTNGTYEILDVGCCGMAGAFGFEKEHYDFSKKIFDGDLGKAIAKFPDEQLILASGFSCRHQIDELSEKKVKHWIEILDYTST